MCLKRSFVGVFFSTLYEKMKYKFGLHGSLKAIEGKGSQLAGLLLKASEILASVTGCQLYVISIDAEDKDIIWVTEVWDSKENHTNSLQDERIRLIIGEAMPLLDGMPTGGKSLKVIGGLGL